MLWWRPSHCSDPLDYANCVIAEIWTFFMAFEIVLLMVGSGIVATIVGDLVSRVVFGKSHWEVVGRWVAGIPRGILVNKEIYNSPSVPYESAIGWGFHYLTGIVYGVMYIGFSLLSGIPPGIISAVSFGTLTAVAPYFILMPGMGMGVLARKTPTPLINCLSSLFGHAVFGVGLWLGFRLFNMPL